jgi:hypothetical protein
MRDFGYSSEEYSALRAENARLREALTPSAETKAAYIGEFHMVTDYVNEFGDSVFTKYTVPWTVIKEIMAAILKRGSTKAQGSEATAS